MDVTTVVIPALLTAIATLASVVSILYFQILKRLEECEKDRADLWKKLAGLEKHLEIKNGGN